MSADEDAEGFATSDSLAGIVLLTLLGLAGALIALLVYFAITNDANGAPLVDESGQEQPAQDAPAEDQPAAEQPAQDDSVQGDPVQTVPERPAPGTVVDPDEGGGLPDHLSSDREVADGGDRAPSSNGNGTQPNSGGPTPPSDDAASDGSAPLAGAGGSDTADGVTATDSPAASSEDGDRDGTDRVPAITVSRSPRDVHVRHVDLDGDGVDERVSAMLIGNQVRVEVERRANGGWSVVDRAYGPVADRLAQLGVSDFTGDGRPDVHTRQRVATHGESATFWTWSDRLVPATASGGCWEGGNTIGLVGVQLRPREVVALCRDDDLPPSLWSSATYEWAGDRWRWVSEDGVYLR